MGAGETLAVIRKGECCRELLRGRGRAKIREEAVTWPGGGSRTVAGDTEAWEDASWVRRFIGTKTFSVRSLLPRYKTHRYLSQGLQGH